MLAVAALALPAPARAADAHADTVIAASRAALGLDALGTVRTMHLHGSANVLGFSGPGDLWLDVRSGDFAQYADTGPVAGSQGWDGKLSWNRDVSGVVWDDASEQSVYAALDSAYLNRYALWAPGYGGATVTSKGTETHGSETDDVLEITPPHSAPFTLAFDAATHLPVRMTTVLGQITTVTTFSDYRSVGGVRVPFAQTAEVQGNVVTFHAESAVVNDAGTAQALRRPSAHVTDASLPSGTTSIPFELVDNHVVLPVTIDGKGPFRFIFDSGGSNIVDAGLAKELGLKPAGQLAGSGVGAGTEAFQLARVDALGVGDATLRDQVFAVAPVRAGFGVSSGKPVDGLIGFEVLARFVTTFDYGSSRVVLRTQQATGAPATANAHTVPMVFNGQHPMLDCTIANVPTRCVADTGSRIGLTALAPFVAAHPSIVPASATAVGANGFGIGGASMGRLARMTLEIGGFTVPDVITDVSTARAGAFADPYYGGNVGGAVWRRFALTFDYARMTITLAPDAQFAQRDTYDRSGTFLIAAGGKITVADVRPGTPAAAAGLVKGDVLTTVGGKDAAALGLAAVRDAFREAPGTAVALGVSGPGGARSVTLTLRDYV